MAGPNAKQIVLLVILWGTIVALWLWRRFVAIPRRLERARAKAERLRQEQADGTPPSPADYRFAIGFDVAGFQVRDLRDSRRPPLATRWADVNRLVVFKRDLLTVDCICLLVEHADGSTVELDEEMARWQSFVAALPQHLPGCRAWEDWFVAAFAAAFEANPTDIYRRAT